MTYQIVYYSPDGYALKMAEVFREWLPEDTSMEALHQTSIPTADVQMVGFDLNLANLNTLPQNIDNYLKMLEGKSVFLFATVPFQPDDALSSQIHKCVAKALPRECDYRGLYICPAQAPEAIVNGFQDAVQRHPKNTRAKHWLERCEKAQGRPNSRDLEEGVRFMRYVLELK